MKKQTRIFVTVLLIFLVLFAIVWLAVDRFKYITSYMPAREIPDFEKYQDAFNLVADKLWEIYLKEKEENNIERLMSWTILKDTWDLKCYANGEEYDLSIAISEDIERAYSMVQKAFAARHESGLWFFDVVEGQVTFYSSKHLYAIFCVMDSSRPKDPFSSSYSSYNGDDFYFNRINRTYHPLDAHFKEINRIWYQCVG